MTGQGKGPHLSGGAQFTMGAFEHPQITLFVILRWIAAGSGLVLGFGIGLKHFGCAGGWGGAITCAKHGVRHKPMRPFQIILKVLLLAGCMVFLVGTSARSEDDGGKVKARKVRVGTYDSRSVAVAFAGSPVFNQWLSGLKAEREKAVAAGDQKRVAEVEAEGASEQRLLHTQGFSTAPVTNILDQIKDKLPAIKKKAGVTVLVSKWDKATLARYGDADLVDVTMALVDAFNPTERQRKSALEIQKHKPISLEEAERIKD